MCNLNFIQLLCLQERGGCHPLHITSTTSYEPQNRRGTTPFGRRGIRQQNKNAITQGRVPLLSYHSRYICQSTFDAILWTNAILHSGELLAKVVFVRLEKELKDCLRLIVDDNNLCYLLIPQGEERQIKDQRSQKCRI